MSVCVCVCVCVEGVGGELCVCVCVYYQVLRGSHIGGILGYNISSQRLIEERIGTNFIWHL